MGQIRSALLRPLRSFNIENRTARLLDREKPIPAPRYPATERQMEVTKKLYPDIKEKLNVKDEQLDQRLRSVFVVSTDTETIVDDKPISEVLKQKEEFARCQDPTSRAELYHPVDIPVGKCTIRKIIEFLGKHEDDPETYTAEKIAVELKLDKEDVSNVLKHYSILIAKPPLMSRNIGWSALDSDEKEG